MLIFKEFVIEDIKNVSYINNILKVFLKSNKTFSYNLNDNIKNNIKINKIYITDNIKFLINQENAECLIIEI